MTPGRRVEERDGLAIVTYVWPALLDGGERRPLESTFEIDRDQVRRVISSFGIPESWQTRAFKFRTRQELERQKQAHFAAAARRGIILSNGKWSPDYRWMIAHSRADLEQPAHEILRAARQSRARQGREVIGAMAAFVQHLRYEVQDSHRIGATGERILTCGIHMPLETLYRGFGDCDTKSALLAALLANVEGMGVVFLRGNGHLFAGVRAPPRSGDRYVEIRGVRYVLIEATDFWPMGRIPDHLWQSVGRNEFEIIKVF